MDNLKLQISYTPKVIKIIVYMFSQIIRIINDGITSLFCNINGEKNSTFKIFISFIIIPLIAAMYFKNRDMKDIIDVLINCLSIFTALIFSALFIVPDKLSQRIKYLQEKGDDSKNNYLIRFLNLSKIFVKQVSFIIVLCMVLIVLLILQKIQTCSILVFANSFLFTVLIMYLLLILSNIYILLMDDIDKSAKDIK